MDGPEINRSEVMSRRFEIVEQIAIIAGKHKAELEPLTEELKMCETYIKDTMNQGNEQQFKTTSGDMCYFVTKDSVTVKDMDSVIGRVLEEAPPPAQLGITDPEVWKGVLNHIKATGLWQMFNKAVNKTTVKEMIDTTQVVPPGVDYSAYRDLAWRRGKG